MKETGSLRIPTIVQRVSPLSLHRLLAKGGEGSGLFLGIFGGLIALFEPLITLYES